MDAAQKLTLLTLLKGARASLSAVLLQLEAAIFALEGHKSPQAEPKETPAKEWPEKAECKHEFREAAPANRDPGRMLCQNPKCRALIPGGES